MALRSTYNNILITQGIFQLHLYIDLVILFHGVVAKLSSASYSYILAILHQ